jgi:signal peptidase I
MFRQLCGIERANSLSALVRAADLQVMDGSGRWTPGRLRLLLALALLINPVTLVVLMYFTVLPGYGVGTSMSPALEPGNITFRDRLTLRFTAPRRGDIVSFRNPESELPEQIGKRVIGLPGERLMMVRGVVFIDGQELSEPYVRIPYDRTWDNLAEFQLGPDQYWVMGDNRGVSFDSRAFGPVDESAFRARQLGATAWPLHAATPIGLAMAGTLLGFMATCSAVFGRKCAREARSVGDSRWLAAWGVFLWAFGFWVIVRRSLAEHYQAQGEVWHVARRSRAAPPPPPGADEAPIPTESPIATVIVAPTMGFRHHLPLGLAVGLGIAGAPVMITTALWGPALVWLGGFDPGEPRRWRHIAELSAIAAVLAIFATLVLPFVPVLVAVAGMFFVGLGLWKRRTRRALARFLQATETPGTAHHGYSLKTRPFRKSDSPRSKAS